MDIIIYKLDDKTNTKARVGPFDIGPTPDNKEFSEFDDYFKWALGRELEYDDRKQFVISCMWCDNVQLLVDDYCYNCYESSYERLYDKFERIKTSYDSDQEDFSDDNIAIRNFVNHDFSGDLDDSTKKEYIFRIMKVVSKLL